LKPVLAAVAKESPPPGRFDEKLLYGALYVMPVILNKLEVVELVTSQRSYPSRGLGLASEPVIPTWMVKLLFELTDCVEGVKVNTSVVVAANPAEATAPISTVRRMSFFIRLEFEV
jgi:hypothetical protein